MCRRVWKEKTGKFLSKCNQKLYQCGNTTVIRTGQFYQNETSFFQKKQPRKKLTEHVFPETRALSCDSLQKNLYTFITFTSIRGGTIKSRGCKIGKNGVLGPPPRVKFFPSGYPARSYPSRSNLPNRVNPLGYPLGQEKNGQRYMIKYSGTINIGLLTYI